MFALTTLRLASIAWLCHLSMAAAFAQTPRAPGVTDSAVTFGVSGCFSNPTWGTNCTNLRKGIEAAFTQVNQRGGVHGRKLQLDVLDDAYDPKRTAENVKTFAQSNKVLGMVGLMGGALTVAAMPMLRAYQMPAIGGTTGTDEARAFNPYLFHVRASYRSEVNKIVEHVTTIQQTRIAVVYPSTAFGTSVASMTLAALKERQLQPVLTDEFDTSKFDAADVAKRVAAASPQVVIALLSAGQMADYLAALDKTAARPTTYTLSVMSHQALLEKAGDTGRKVVITQVMPPFWSTVNPLAKGYREALHKYSPQDEPNYLSWEGYVSGMVVAEALKSAGPALDRRSFLAALYSPQGIDVGGYRVQYNNTSHEGSHFVDLTLLAAAQRLVR